MRGFRGLVLLGCKLALEGWDSNGGVLWGLVCNIILEPKRTALQKLYKNNRLMNSLMEIERTCRFARIQNGHPA